MSNKILSGPTENHQWQFNIFDQGWTVPIYFKLLIFSFLYLLYIQSYIFNIHINLIPMSVISQCRLKYLLFFFSWSDKQLFRFNNNEAAWLHENKSALVKTLL